jgi:hypothetical protein
MAPSTITNSAADLAAIRRDLASAVQLAADRDERLEWQLDLTYEWAHDTEHQTQRVTTTTIRGWIALEEKAAHAAREAYTAARAELDAFDQANPDLNDRPGHG